MNKEDEDKLRELKIEYLKQPMKRAVIKRKIAKIITLQNKVGETNKQ